MKTTTTLRLAGAALLAAFLPCAHALDLHPDGIGLHAGAGDHGATMAGVGVIWDWDFERLRRSEVTAHTELMLNEWRADALGGGSQSVTQVALVPSVRMQLARGQSPWYLEVGIGVSWMDKLYTTPAKRFSTRWNFYDVLGVGRSFGAGRRNDIGLRLVHVSNAGLKNPNPGETFLQLRYVRRF